MKPIILFLFFTMFNSVYTQAQKLPANLFDMSAWTLVNRQGAVMTDQGKKAFVINEGAGAGMMLVNGYEFSSGTIEFNVKGKDLAGQSFVGVAFHIQNDSTYDAIYFRPFNFKNADTVRRTRAVQYISMPKYDWDLLRSSHPGKYENRVHPVPDPNGWFHARIEVGETTIRVFVNHSSAPSLEVERLSHAGRGKFAWWVGNGSEGSFADLKITPGKR